MLFKHSSVNIRSKGQKAGLPSVCSEGSTYWENAGKSNKAICSPHTANKKTGRVLLQGLPAGPKRHNSSNGKTNIFLEKMIKLEAGKANTIFKRAAGELVWSFPRSH